MLHSKRPPPLTFSPPTPTGDIKRVAPTTFQLSNTPISILRDRSPRHAPPFSPSAFLQIPIPQSLPSTPFSPSFERATRDCGPNCLIWVLLASNLFSMAWSYLVVTAATDRRSGWYDSFHASEVLWEGGWASCRTFAALISLTNVILVIKTCVQLIRSGITISDPKSTTFIGRLAFRTALVGALVAAFGVVAMVGLIPWRMTWVEVGREDDNLLFAWDG
ncbi:hypothetical protein BJ508DRAFT_329154 [Ascobolus immersus RN42]|uniref:Uncharacterized protein n=1 Tax=Ascobolus immersus RN42 TaxID=1160509 RepID=A0A3N4I358_ASCIM|nr:hypothetical protein BJ508DRAFT_329154 [Ascobolus immersus RN42]